jgi:hypothetical protein
LLANFKNKLKLPFAKQDLTKQPNALFYRKGQYMYAMSLLFMIEIKVLFSKSNALCKYQNNAYISKYKTMSKES